MILVPNSDNSCFLPIELNQRKNYLALKTIFIFIVHTLSFYKNLMFYEVYFVLCWFMTWRRCNINFKIISWFPKKYMSNCHAVFLIYLGKKANFWAFLILNTSKNFVTKPFLPDDKICLFDYKQKVSEKRFI